MRIVVVCCGVCVTLEQGEQGLCTCTVVVLVPLLVLCVLCHMRTHLFVPLFLGCFSWSPRTSAWNSVVALGCMATGLACMVGLDKVSGGCVHTVCVCSCCCRAGVSSSRVGFGCAAVGFGCIWLLDGVLSW